MFVIARAITYAALFMGFVLVFLPARLLSQAGISGPPAVGAPQVAGIIVAVLGTAVAVWSILTLALIGKGTPAPFDPPRRMVVQGPFRYVRNPMYIGASLALAGAALAYESLPLLGYAGVFLLATHIFVVWYEEPTLRRSFGDEYTAYCARVARWRPTL